MTVSRSRRSRAFALALDIVVEVGIPENLDLQALRRLVRFVLAAEQTTGQWTVTVVLTGDAQIRLLHRDYMASDTPTDVMTFPLGEPIPGSMADAGGDIVVSVERAADQAGDYGQTVGDEIRFLVVHGVLHLCGWKDTSEDNQARMLERQTALIAAFDRR